MTFRIILLLFLIIFCNALNATETDNTIDNPSEKKETPEEKKVKPQIKPKPQITLETQDPYDQIRVWKDLRLIIITKNTDPDGIVVKEAKVKIPKSICIINQLELDKVDDQNDGYAEIKIDHFQELRNLDVQYEIPLTIEACELSEYRKNFFRLLFYTPKNEKILVKIGYQPLSEYNADSDALKYTAAVPLSIKFGASWWSIYIGSICGVLLSSIFLMFIVFHDQEQIKATDPQAQTIPFSRIMRDYCLKILRGIITMSLLIPLLFVTSDIKLPANINLQDFWGGFALGLFGEKLFTILYEKLFK